MYLTFCKTPRDAIQTAAPVVELNEIQRAALETGRVTVDEALRFGNECQATAFKEMAPIGVALECTDHLMLYYFMASRIEQMRTEEGAEPQAAPAPDEPQEWTEAEEGELMMTFLGLCGEGGVPGVF